MKGDPTNLAHINEKPYERASAHVAPSERKTHSNTIENTPDAVAQSM